MNGRPLDTRYAGCRFRSRLEARWAVFFDAMGIPWQYEVQGYIVGPGRSYLPDFLLTDCGTWVEVKGAEEELSHDLMLAAAKRLPYRDCKDEIGPRLLILGPIPEPPKRGDLGWIGLDYGYFWHGEILDGGRSFTCIIRRGEWQCSCGHRRTGDRKLRPGELCEHLRNFTGELDIDAPHDTEAPMDHWWGFGRYGDRKCPRVLRETSRSTPVNGDPDEPWLIAVPDEEDGVPPLLATAYRKAREARFEHGQTPRRPRKRAQ